MSDTTDRQPLGFEADLVLSEDGDNLLGINNDERVNRSLATQERIGKTSYSAYVNHVQYGSYDDKDACLIGIDIDFRFPPKAHSRFSSAEVEVTFERALDIFGQIRERESKKVFEISVPLVFNVPLGSAQVSGKWSKETSATEEGRQELYGNLAQDDDHDDGANSVTWDLTENPISKEGIFRSFRGVVVLFVRPSEHSWMHVSIKPIVKASLDPRRIFTKRLAGDRDEPVLLDVEQTRGRQVCFGYDKFDADDFPWQEVLSLPQPLGEKKSDGGGNVQ